MKTYTTILFDWDGCLAQTLDVWVDAYKDTFAEYGIFPTTSDITTQVFGSWDGPKKLGIKNIEEFTAKLLERLNAEFPRAPLYPYVSEMLQTLGEKEKRLALVTTSKKSAIMRALETHRMTSLFDLILAAEDVEHHKPHPEIIEKALEFFHAKKEECIIIGDSKSDLGAAQNASIDSVLFYPKKNEQFYDLNMLKTYHPTYIVHDFRKVFEIVQ